MAVFLNEQNAVFDLVGSEFPMMLSTGAEETGRVLLEFLRLLYDQIFAGIAELKPRRAPRAASEDSARRSMPSSQVPLHLLSWLRELEGAVEDMHLGPVTPATVELVWKAFEGSLPRFPCLRKHGPGYYRFDPHSLSSTPDVSLLNSVLLQPPPPFERSAFVITKRCVLAHCAPRVFGPMTVPIEPRRLLLPFHESERKDHGMFKSHSCSTRRDGDREQPANGTRLHPSRRPRRTTTLTRRDSSQEVEFSREEATTRNTR